MKSRKGWGVLLLPLLFAACTSTKADVQTVCDSSRVSLLERRSELRTDQERFDFLMEWSNRNIWTDGGRELVAKLKRPELSWSDKALELRAAAKANQIARCDLPRWIDAHSAADSAGK